MSERLPRIALAVLIVGLAAHNLVMAELWDAGIRGAALDVVAAWKDVLLAAALAVALLAARSVPLRLWADRLALAYAAFVLLYWLLPQSWLDGGATHRGQLFAARHDLIPVAAYFLGRLLVLTPQSWRRLSLALVGVAVGLSVWGLIDVYLVPLQWWRDSGVPGWFNEQLGLDYQGALRAARELDLQHRRREQSDPPARLGLPQPARDVLRSRDRAPLSRRAAANVVDRDRWSDRVRRTALDAHARRLPRAGARPRRPGGGPAAVPAGRTRRRLARDRRRLRQGLPTHRPLDELHAVGARLPTRQGAAESRRQRRPTQRRRCLDASHLRNLREGIRTVIHHPLGFGLGNAGVSASRTGVDLKAGESTYTELGVEIGVAGLAVFLAWMVAVLLALWRRSAWLSAAWVAMLAIGVQTDVIGVHWIAYVLFALAGAAIGGGLPDDDDDEAVIIPA